MKLLFLFTLFAGWEGVHIKPGDVEVNIFNESCSMAQLSAVQSSVQILVDLSNRFDPDVTYSYTGFTNQRGWGDFNKDPDNVTFTFDCTDGLLPGFNGQTVPIDNCNSFMSTDHTRCSDGSKRYLTDAGMMIGSHVPEWRIGAVALHEGTHGLWLVDHSTVSGSVMQTLVGVTELSVQIQKVWSGDTFCAVRARLAEVGKVPKEWPVTLPTADDNANLHIPRLEFLGVWWELLMLSDRVSTWTAVGAKLVPVC